MENVHNIIRCQKCRHILLHDYTPYICGNCDHGKCDSYDTRNFIHLAEDTLPDWIKSKIVEEQWTKGKLHCENCRFKVGSFDFISGRKCECKNSILPPVHFISSQVDRPIIVTNVVSNKC